MISKQKKKIFTEIKTDFLANIGNSNAFSGRITTSTSQLRHAISFGKGCFHFFTKNRPQKHQKRAILHTLQANGAGSSPPPPLATLLHVVHQVALARRHRKDLSVLRVKVAFCHKRGKSNRTWAAAIDRSSAAINVKYEGSPNEAARTLLHSFHNQP